MAAAPARALPRRLLVAAIALAAGPLLGLAGPPPAGQRERPRPKEGDNQARKRKNAGWRMFQHSFQPTLTFDDTLGEWLVSGASMALRDRMQLLPPVADRHGLFWNRKAIASSMFEIEFTLSSDSPPGSGTDAALVFWLSPDNFATKFNEQAIVAQESKDWTAGLTSSGLTLLGNRPEFEGLAVVFREDPAGQNVAALWSKGQPRINSAQELVSNAEQSNRKPLIWRTQETKVKITMSRFRGIEGAIAMGPNGSWQQFFKLPPGTVPKDSQLFMGFSGYSGSASGSEMSLRRLATTNFDEKVAGEDGGNALQGMNDQWAKTLEEEKRYVTQASQAEAVVRLTKLLKEHVERYEKAGNEIQQSLGNLESKLDNLGAEMSTYIAAAQAFSFESGSFSQSDIMSHITSIRDVLARNTAAHDVKMKAVHKAAQDLKQSDGGRASTAESRQKLEDTYLQAKSLEQQASTGASQSTYLFFMIFASVGVLVYLFFSRMRYYEKKNFF